MTNNKRFVFLAILSTFWWLQLTEVGAATISGDIPPLEFELLKDNEQLAQRGIITANTISQRSINIPSLWWAREQIDPYRGRLVINWLAYSEEKRIDLIVNRQLWSLLDYLNRYRFLHQFGTVARGYEYNLRVFNQQQQCLATYTCDYTMDIPGCKIKLDSDFDGLQL